MRKNLMKVFVQALLVIMTCFFCIGCKEKFCSWYSIGPIQAIGNNEQLYMFLELDRILSRSYKTYDAPSTYPKGHIQDFLIISPNGKIIKKTRINTANNCDGVTFHPNLSHVFIENKKLYLFSGASCDEQESLFIWKDNDNRFVLLPKEDGVKFFKSIKSDYYKLNVVSQEKELDLLSEKNGWKPVYSDMSIGNDKFTWNGITFTVSYSGDKYEGYFEITISADKPMKDFPIVLKYERDRKYFGYSEFKNLSDEEYGHPR